MPHVIARGLKPKTAPILQNITLVNSLKNYTDITCGFYSDNEKGDSVVINGPQGTDVVHFEECGEKCSYKSVSNDQFGHW